MPLHVWMAALLLLSPMLLKFDMSIHAFAISIGTILWHTIFPHVHKDPEEKLLPTREEFIARLELDEDVSDQDSSVQCPTCWHDLESPVRLICGHRFCESCILPWLSTGSARSCPVCRKNLFQVDKLPTSEIMQHIFHKLRVCTAIISLLIPLLKTIPCLSILRPSLYGFDPIARCIVGGGTSNTECLTNFARDCLSVLMVVSAWRSFRAYGEEWQRSQMGGSFNIYAALGWVWHCNGELKTLHALLVMAYRKQW